MISATDIQNSLKTKFVGQIIHTFDVVDSTNTVAKHLADAGGPEGTTVIADCQTDGRGRLNRQWYGEPGKGILLSIILRPKKPDVSQILTYLAAVSAAEAVEEILGRPVECKWPNDLLINGRKFTGILIESSWRQSSVEHAVVGIGMNVNEEKFPLELRKKATSLKIEFGHEVDRAVLICGILQHLETNYLGCTAKGSGDVLDAWNKRCMMFGREITLDQSGRILTGKALRLDGDGALVIKDHDHEIKVFGGDVAVLN